MRIIKPGILPNKKVYFGTCSNCKAQVEYIQSETIPGQMGLGRIAHCPTEGCGRYIDVIPKMEGF